MNEKSDLPEVAHEAANRLTVAARMLGDHECSPQKRDYTGGFELSIVREVMEDVAATLREAADHSPMMEGGA